MGILNSFILCGLLLFPSNSWHPLTSAVSGVRETLSLPLISGPYSQFMFSLSAFPLHRIEGTGSQSALGTRVVEMRGSSTDVCQKLMWERWQHPPSPKREGKIPHGNARLQLKGLTVVFQGEMGAPGVRGDKGEKVILLFWPEPLRPGEGSLC